MKDKCYTCEEKIINPKYIFQESTMVGLFPFDFCSKKCFLKFIFKKFKKDVRRLEWKK